MLQRIVIFSNASAGRDPRILNAAVAVFDQYGIDYEWFSPRDVDDLRRSISALGDNIDAVVIAGGDGTINAALPAVVKASIPMGVLPTGTANDFARTLNLPADLGEAARVITEGRMQPLDLGRVNGRLFCNVAHIGFGVRAQTEALNAEHKKWLRGLSYAVSIWRARRLLTSFTAEVSVDGRTERVRTIHLSVGNGRFYGGGVPIEADAAIDDNLLDAYSIPPQRGLGLLHAIRDVRRGGLPSSPVWRAKGQHIVIRTRRPRRVLADGEEVGHTPAEFDLLPRVLSVIVPLGGYAPGLASETVSSR
ncbi:lipid kinase [Aquisalimonas lutea]|uniref:lipid kinase n=1 Tax=Aquisalimonas lutea TaxID=1327750 RepID=UPI0025B42ECA|nr:lipid kinase [Aquisalimonas lutea]MDN3518522.1 lipid kinase [Aquisalimonas lutea]